VDLPPTSGKLVDFLGDTEVDSIAHTDVAEYMKFKGMHTLLIVHMEKRFRYYFQQWKTIGNQSTAIPVGQKQC